jgi:hypothetical protein
MALIKHIPSGGNITEVDLWTNESLSTTVTAVTLSDDINNYDALKFEFCASSSLSDRTTSIMVDVDVFKSVPTSGGRQYKLFESPVITGDSNDQYTTTFVRTSDTIVTYAAGIGSNRGLNVPTRIVGIKYN